jgi:hypothetical protein
LRRLRTADTWTFARRSAPSASLALRANSRAIGTARLREPPIAHDATHGLFDALVDQSLHLFRKLVRPAADAPLARERLAALGTALQHPAGFTAPIARSARSGAALPNALHDLRHAVHEFLFADGTIAVRIEPIKYPLEHLLRNRRSFGSICLCGSVRRRRIRLRPCADGQSENAYA